MVVVADKRRVSVMIANAVLGPLGVIKHRELARLG
jgi:hypothetical protein